MNKFEMSYSICFGFRDQYDVISLNPMMPNTIKRYFYNQHKYAFYPFYLNE